MMNEKYAQFQALVESHSALLYRYAYWLCQDKQTAEDLVQETFLRAWRSLSQLREAKAAKGWLMTIVRRENARRFQKKTLLQDEGKDLENLPGTLEFSTDTQAWVLRRALAQLSGSYRDPLVMQVLVGLSCEEIATQMGISKEAVMTRLFRARKALRALLTEPSQVKREDKQ